MSTFTGVIIFERLALIVLLINELHVPLLLTGDVPALPLKIFSKCTLT
jgi:hypothetical protein